MACFQSVIYANVSAHPYEFSCFIFRSRYDMIMMSALH